jgi:hypothetical protein
MMELKTLENEIDIRRHAEVDMTWRRLYACLWRFKRKPLIHKIENWFTVPHVDLHKGCPRLKVLKGYEIVHQCICAEDEEVTRILKVAKFEAAKAVAKQRLQKAIDARNAKRAIKVRQQEKDTAKHVAQEIVYNNLQKSGNLNKALREASKQRVENPAVAGHVAQIVNAAKVSAKVEEKAAAGGCENKEVDCKSVAGGAGVDTEKLERCLSKANSEVVKGNLRKAFTVGNLHSGCALLSLASNTMLKDIHECMCNSASSGGNGSGAHESARMVDAIADSGPKGLKDKK